MLLRRRARIGSNFVKKERVFKRDPGLARYEIRIPGVLIPYFFDGFQPAATITMSNENVVTSVISGATLSVKVTARISLGDISRPS